MIKLLYSTDWHSREKSPSTRLDEFGETIELKLKDFFKTGHDLEVDAFLCGGDYFDTPYVSPNYVTKIGQLLKDELKGKTMYGVWGNHDVIGWNPNTVKRLSHGVFQHFFSGFEIVGKEPTIIEKEGERVAITGISSYAQLDRDLLDDDGNVLEHRSRDYIVDKTEDIPLIHIVHGYLSEKPILDSIPHTVIDDIADTAADVVLTGHEHTGFSVREVNGTTVFNPGALSRVFASHAEMNRMPQYALIEISDTGETKVTPVQCKVARQGDQVMSRSVIEEKKAKEKIIEQSKKDISEVLKNISVTGVDLNVILQAFEEQTDEHVMRETRRRLDL